MRVGGAEMMLLKILKNLNKNLYQPSVISLTTLGDLGQSIINIGIPVYAVGLTKSLNLPFKILKMFWLLNQIRPSIVHSWMYHADLIGGLLAYILRVKFIVWCLRNSGLSKNRNKRSTQLIVKFCSYLSHIIPDRIVSCSKVAVFNHESLGYSSEKFTVIPNCFNLNEFKPDSSYKSVLCKELNIPNTCKFVGIVGRYDPQKNHIGFLESAFYVVQNHPKVQFVLVGSGIDHNNKSLMSKIYELGLHDHCHLLGLRKDIAKIMTSFDVLVSSSSWGEGFPNVVGEAMSCGVPCVVTDVGDSSFIVGEAGIVVSINDTKALANGINNILYLNIREYNLLCASARSRIEKKFNITKIVQEYESIYSLHATKRLITNSIT